MHVAGKLDLSAKYANKSIRETPRLTKEFKDLAFLVLKLYLGQDDMPIEDYVIMEGANIIEVEYWMTKLVDMTLRHRIEPPSLTLMQSPWTI